MYLICPSSSITYNGLRKHLYNDHIKRPEKGSRAEKNAASFFRCGNCEERFFGPAELISHLRTDLTENKFRRKKEEKFVIFCPAARCKTFSTTKLGTWKSHVSRLHQNGFLSVKFKPEYFIGPPPSSICGSLDVEESVGCCGNSGEDTGVPFSQNSFYEDVAASRMDWSSTDEGSETFEPEDVFEERMSRSLL